MRINSPRGPAPYLNRRDQLRMLAMVGLLAVVVVAMRWAAQPSSWYWLTGPPADQVQRSGERRLDEIDFSVRTERPGDLKPGEFRAVNEAEESADIGEATAPVTTDSLAISPRILKTVEDATVGLRSGEANAYYHVIASVRDNDPQRLQQAARSDLAFAELMIDPARYRGTIVTVVGELRRLQPFESGENNYGIGSLYEGWLFTSDSGNNPYRIVCLSVGEGVPTGEELDPPSYVRTTGYFFKKQGYLSQGGLHTAPLILSREISLVQSAVVPIGSQTGGRYVVAVLVVMACGIALLLWRFTQSDLRFGRRHVKAYVNLDEDQSARLNELPTVDVGELLRQMGEQEQKSESE